MEVEITKRCSHAFMELPHVKTLGPRQSLSAIELGERRSDTTSSSWGGTYRCGAHPGVGEPARAAMYQPCYAARSAGGDGLCPAGRGRRGRSPASCLAKAGAISRRMFALPRLHRTGIEPYRALFLAALHDRSSTQEHGVCLFIDWDTGGLGVYAVDFADGNARILTSSFNRRSARWRWERRSPARAPAGSHAGRARLWAIWGRGGRVSSRREDLLRRFWLADRERFGARSRRCARRASPAGALPDHARCALCAVSAGLAMAVDALDAAVNHCDAPLRVVGRARRPAGTSFRAPCAGHAAIFRCIWRQGRVFRGRRRLAVAEEHLGTKGTV